jgi:cupin 2 domain-containing protein
MELKNLFSDIPAYLPEEWTQVVAQNKGVTIERIVSRGHCSAEDFWYDQAWDEWVAVVQGSAGIELRGQPDIIRLAQGDHLLIPAHVKHRVAWTSADPQTIWLAVHFRGPAQAGD